MKMPESDKTKEIPMKPIVVEGELTGVPDGTRVSLAFRVKKTRAFCYADKTLHDTIRNGKFHIEKKFIYKDFDENDDNVEYMVIDIQNIPFEDDSFDVVIANMMLYHVPDIDKGLSEVRRVLKGGGNFYAATYGEHGIMEHLAKLLGRYGVTDTTSRAFTLQNGQKILGEYFGNVEMLRYEDSLAVTNVDDLVEYIYSLSNMSSLASVPKDEIRKVFTQNMLDGVLNVPKEYGMFVAN